MALDNPDSLGDKVASCRRRKGLLMNTKNIKRHDCYYGCNKYTMGVKFKENASYRGSIVLKKCWQCPNYPPNSYPLPWIHRCPEAFWSNWLPLAKICNLPRMALSRRMRDKSIEMRVVEDPVSESQLEKVLTYGKELLYRNSYPEGSPGFFFSVCSLHLNLNPPN